MPLLQLQVVLLVGVILLSLRAPPCSAAATDTVSPGNGLAAGGRLVSNNSKFALGFFKMDNKSPHRTSPNNQGGIGIVAFRYADLQHATKRLDGARQGEKQFRAEVSSVGVIQHINLVKLVAFCCEGGKRLLVYEYMPNHSLDVHSFTANGRVLDWSLRYQIATGVAEF